MLLDLGRQEYHLDYEQGPIYLGEGYTPKAFCSNRN
jgi:hypothetical protein